MSYNFNEQSNQDLVKGPQWLKKGYGVYSNGKPPVDDSEDNNYQHYADNATSTGALPTFKPANASNQFEITTGHAVIDTALTLNATAVPATPTAAVNGTVGTTHYSYAVVGRGGNLQAPSAAVSPTTGNATLSATNSITITWTPTPGFHAYDIYRTASSGTPSTTGLIGSVNAGFGPNVLTPTLSFTDTGLTADGSTIPSANSTGAVAGDVQVYGNIAANALSTPAQPLVVSNGSGAVTWAYKIVARSGSLTTPAGHTAASVAGSTATGVATITGTANGNVITWQPVPGAVSYDVYRTTAGTSPSTTGKLANVTGHTYTDIGGAGDSSSAPTTNNTGVITGSIAGSSLTNNSVTSTQLDPQTIQYVSVALTLAQLQALNTAPVSVIAAQGAGTLIEVCSAVLELVYGSAAFTGGGTVQLSYGAATTYPASGTIAATMFTTFSANQATIVDGALAVTATSHILNTAVYLFGNSGNFSAGTGATGILKIAYRVHNTLS